MIYFVSGRKELFENDVYKCISVEESLEKLEKLQVVGLDTETEGFDPYTKALINSLPRNGFKLTEGVQPLDDVIGCPYYENCPVRMDKCEKNKPKLINHNGVMIRCFNYEEVNDES